MRVVVVLMMLSAMLSALPFSGCDCTAEPIVAARPIAEVPERLDFGPIGEGTSVTQPIVVENVGQADLEVTAVIGAESTEFSVETQIITIRPRETGNINIRFSPIGVGEDNGSVILTTNDERAPEHTVLLHGGPIEPSLVAPAEVNFAPADASIVGRTVTIQNDGLAKLHVVSIAVDAGANPQFQTDAEFDFDILPGATFNFQVTHSRSTRTDEGRLLIRTNDPADAAQGGVRAVRLLPDALGPCEDGIDNDGDELSDFPDDPGCSDYFDDTEENQVDCIDGATQICGTDNGICEPGLRTCEGGTFGACEGETLGNSAELLCDGLDDDCDGREDEEVIVACDANGDTPGDGCLGFRECVEDGGGVFGDCVPNMSGPERCDGEDNNCDGVIDNGVRESCVGTGNCAGSRLCIPGGTGQFGGCVCDAVCGDGDQAASEECDDGNTDGDDGCSPTCEEEFCGDGVTNNVVEQCDDSNNQDLDGCNADCTNERCGDGVRQIARGEQCDDGGTLNGDGCSSTCTIETPQCDPDGSYNLDMNDRFTFSCCGGIVTFNVQRMQISNDGARADLLPTASTQGAGNFPFDSGSATCPDGAVSYNEFFGGSCNEDYTISGNFVDANTIDATLTMTFTGDCGEGSICEFFGDPCNNATFEFTARK